MGRLLVALMVFGLALAVIKLVIVAIVLAGLIFRPKETCGILLVGGWFTLTKAYPIAGFGLLAFFIIAGIVMAVKKGKSDPT